jgi:hypothetical protein
MRIDQQNRRSCIALLILLAGLAGLVLWMSLGGVSSETTGNDVKADVTPLHDDPGSAAAQKSGP